MPSHKNRKIGLAFAATLPVLAPIATHAQQQNDYTYGNAVFDTTTKTGDWYGKVAGSLEVIASKNTSDGQSLVNLSKNTLQRGEALLEQAVRSGSATQWEQAKGLIELGLDQAKRGETLQESARQMNVLQNGMLEKVAKGGEIAAHVGNVNTVYQSLTNEFGGDLQGSSSSSFIGQLAERVVLDVFIGVGSAVARGDWVGAVSDGSAIVTKSISDIGNSYVQMENAWAQAELAEAGYKETLVRYYKQIDRKVAEYGAEVGATEKELAKLKAVLSGAPAGTPGAEGVDGVNTSDPRFEANGLPDTQYWTWLKNNDPQKLVNLGIDPNAPVGIDVPPGTYATNGSLISDNTSSAVTSSQNPNGSGTAAKEYTTGDGSNYPTYDPNADSGEQPVDLTGSDSSISDIFETAFEDEQATDDPFVNIEGIKYLDGNEQVYMGELADEMLRRVGARAMTMDGTIFVANDFDPNNAEDQGLYAHEQVVQRAQSAVNRDEELSAEQLRVLIEHGARIEQMVLQAGAGNNLSGDAVLASLRAEQRKMGGLLARLNSGGQTGETAGIGDPIIIGEDDFLDDVLDAFAEIEEEKRAEEERSVLGAIKTTDTAASPFGDTPVTFDPVTFDSVTFDPVTYNPVTSDPVTFDPVTYDPVTSDPVEFSGFEEFSIGPEYLSDGGLEFTYETDTGSWDAWLDATGNRSKVENIATNLNITVAELLGAWKVHVLNAKNPSWMQWANSQPSAAGTTGAVGFQDRWKVRLSQRDIAILLNRYFGNDVYDTASLPKGLENFAPAEIPTPPTTPVEPEITFEDKTATAATKPVQTSRGFAIDASALFNQGAASPSQVLFDQYIQEYRATGQRPPRDNFVPNQQSGFGFVARQSVDGATRNAVNDAIDQAELRALSQRTGRPEHSIRNEANIYGYEITDWVRLSNQEIARIKAQKTLDEALSRVASVQGELTRARAEAARVRKAEEERYARVQNARAPTNFVGPSIGRSTVVPGKTLGTPSFSGSSFVNTQQAQAVVKAPTSLTPPAGSTYANKIAAAQAAADYVAKRLADAQKTVASARTALERAKAAERATSVANLNSTLNTQPVTTGTPVVQTPQFTNPAIEAQRRNALAAEQASLRAFNAAKAAEAARNAEAARQAEAARRAEAVRRAVAAVEARRRADAERERLARLRQAETERSGAVQVVAANQRQNWNSIRSRRGASTAIISNNVSHIGSPAGTGRLRPATEYNSGRISLVAGGGSIEAGELRIVTGNAATHLSQGTSFGSVSAPGGGLITGVNNTGADFTVAEQTFQLSGGQRTFTLDTLANFVTTEFPDFVGTQFDDTGRISLITPAGESFSLNTVFSQSVNQSTFTPVTTGPELGGGGAGQTGFERVGVDRLPVAPGGTVTLRIEVDNVGDQLFPSAVLLNETKAR